MRRRQASGCPARRPPRPRRSDRHRERQHIVVTPGEGLSERGASGYGDVCSSKPTPDRSAIWERSATRPSETSIMAVAPARPGHLPLGQEGRGGLRPHQGALRVGPFVRPGQAGGPARGAGAARRPRPPSCPVTQIVSPGWAPLRSTGRPFTHPVRRDADDQFRPSAEVAAYNRTVKGRGCFQDPLVELPLSASGPAPTTETRAWAGTPPMAAMSLRLTAMAFQPKSDRDVNDRSASMPATTVSAVRRSRRPPELTGPSPAGPQQRCRRRTRPRRPAGEATAGSER